jgi:hypothetical protein
LFTNNADAAMRMEEDIIIVLGEVDFDAIDADADRRYS